MIVFKKFSGIFSAIHKFNREARILFRDGAVASEVIEPLKQQTARNVLQAAGIQLRVLGTIDQRKAGIYVGNHQSYLDIPAVVASAPVSFVAKSAISKWPIIGPCARYGGTVFVDRSSQASRNQTVEAMRESLEKRRQSIVVFPAGTTTIDESVPWRWRSFAIAKELNVPVYPFRIRCTPRDKVAFVGEDSFLPHLWKLMHENETSIDIEFGEPFYVSDPEIDAERIRTWTREI